MINAKELIYVKKFKGGALYVSIMVGIVIGIILSLFILVSKNNQRIVTAFSQSSQLYFNLKSAFEIVRSDYFTNQINNKWFKNPVNEDSIKIKKISWGAYLIIAAQTKNRHQELTQNGLFGTYLNPNNGLTVSDNSRPVGLSGKVVFKSNCYLPSAGIKSAYIDGQPYIKDPGNFNFIKQAPAQIQNIDEIFQDAIKAQKKDNIITDSIVVFMPQTLDHSFNRMTCVYHIGSLKLNEVDYRNNVKIIGNELTIDNSCHLENILIICDKIRFKEGFKGSVHVIAKDSIILEKNCELNYPSSLVLHTEESSGLFNQIEFSENCKINGGVIAFRDSKNQNGGKTFIKLHAKSEVNGLIYCSDYIHIEGTINGTIICNKLLIKTASSVYENHILGCEIDPKKYAHILAVPMLFEDNSDFCCCKTVK